ncbi:c-type cytochrome [Oricola cellulosilytica]|uniref:Cytochrome c n=1 Tax=Oricola cellulosilytica TaxID=1429082 RepID=A0A4R0PD51_9HYPH|nr:cytochrome c [Oricola cellulosilytica]TCD15410.1 cytochrome c [Oricola cellulosilytica]
MRAVIVVAGLALAAAVGAVAVYQYLDGRPEAGLLRPNDRQVVLQGAEIYAENCASCHGADLRGQPDWRSPGPDGLMPAPPHDETGHTWHHPDETLFRITKEGVVAAANLKNYTSAMPIYDGVLTDEEIIAALSWIKAQWPEEVRDRHDQLNVQYQAQQEEASQ